METSESIQQLHDHMQVLRDTIVHLNKRYHEDSVSEVTDPVYDELKKELIEYERILGIDDPTSPTKTVGYTTGSNGFEVIRHITPMRSLDNVFNIDELMEWDETLPPEADVVMEPKVDGLSLNLVYLNGFLKTATTRGDGFEGEDVTQNAINVWGVQTSLGNSVHPDSLIEVRGEVKVDKKVFKEINDANREAGKKTYANPRNYAAGSLRLKDPDEVIHRRLSFVAYDYVLDFPDKYYLGTSPHDLLYQWGFKTTTPVPVLVSRKDLSKEVRREIYEQMLERSLAIRPDWEYEIDGMVFKVSQLALRMAMGSRSNSPRWATAYKFPAEEGVSIFHGAKFQVGKSGVVTPVAIIRPVHICGVTVSSPTLHNIAEIERLDLMVGDHIIVSRRGDVIPKIESVILDLRTPDCTPLEYPTHCPSCGCELVRQTHSLYCPNNSGCPDQAVARLVHFVSRDGMNIKDLGEAGITELVKHGLVGSFSSLFYLGYEDLKLVYPTSDITIKKVLKNIQAAKTQPLRKVIFAVGMPGVGEGTAERLALNYKTFEEICNATFEELKSIPDIGPDTAQAVIDACAANRREYLSYDKLFTYVEDAPPDPSIVRDLEGKRVVVTGGSFDGLSRSQMEANVKARGGRLTSTISPNLDILYAGTGAGPEKVKKAIKLGFVQDGIMFVNPQGISE